LKFHLYFIQTERVVSTAANQRAFSSGGNHETATHRTTSLSIYMFNHTCLDYFTKQNRPGEAAAGARTTVANFGVCEGHSGRQLAYCAYLGAIKIQHRCA